MNDRFKEEQKYTYLVPSDQAWRGMGDKLASVHKILFMGYFSYQTDRILERHLRIGEELSAADLIARTKDEGGVMMARGASKLQFREVIDSEGMFLSFE